jgi:hypothetical protein
MAKPCLKKLKKKKKKKKVLLGVICLQQIIYSVSIISNSDHVSVRYHIITTWWFASFFSLLALLSSVIKFLLSSVEIPEQ